MNIINALSDSEACNDFVRAHSERVPHRRSPDFRLGGRRCSYIRVWFLHHSPSRPSILPRACHLPRLPRTHMCLSILLINKLLKERTSLFTVPYFNGVWLQGNSKHKPPSATEYRTESALIAYHRPVAGFSSRHYVANSELREARSFVQYQCKSNLSQ